MENKFEDLSIEEINFEEMQELEEVVTPGWGTLGCCTS